MKDRYKEREVDAAIDTIKDLISLIDGLEDRVDELEEELSKKEDEIINLLSTISDLEQTNNEY